MPTRMPPTHIVFMAHEIHPADEVDWTRDPDWDKELQLREIRNSMVRDLLLMGRAVQFRSSGNSLVPIVHSNDVTMWEPVVARAEYAAIDVGDIVFCQVGTRHCGHCVHEVTHWFDERCLTIGNVKEPPHIIGLVRFEHVYGKLTLVARCQPRARQ